MKKLSLLLLLMTTVVFFSCEEERLIQEDLNQVQDKEFMTQERTNRDNSSDIISNRNGNQLKNESQETNGVEGSFVNPLICPNTQMTLFIDYTSVADYYNNQINTISETDIGLPDLSGSLNSSNQGQNNQNTSIIGLMNNFIYDDIAKMSNYYTIYQVEESSICNYVYKWTINKCEYYKYGPLGPPEENDGEKVVNRQVEDTSNGDIETESDFYKNCF